MDNKENNGLNTISGSPQNISARRSPTGLWLVMDGRARYSTEEASIMEALCDGARDNIPRKAASKMWTGYDACLCFAPAVGKDPQGRSILGIVEYVEDVR